MNILEIKNLNKSFGDHKVLNDLTFSVKENSIYGFLGENGSGKTTTMKIITGLLKKDSGDIFVCGEKVNFGDTKTNRHIGFLPDVPQFYDYMTPYEYLKLCGQLTGIKQAELNHRIEELLILTGLDNSSKKIGGFSRGMRQRLGIAQSLINRPRILICDEPTSALDPVGRREVLNVLKNIKDHTTVIFSTHILSDVETICDSIGILNKGKIQLTGNISSLKKEHKNNILFFTFQSESDCEKAYTIIDSELHLDSNKNNNYLSISLKNNEDSYYDIFSLLLQEKIQIKEFNSHETSLENLFMEVISK